ncbi:MAG: hypothetical protein ACYS7M_10500, partial [Planctomycetota bacterium]
MRRMIAIVTLGVVVLVGSAGYGVDYTYTGPAGSWAYDNALLWTPSGVPGNMDNADGAVDSFTMPGTAEVDQASVWIPNGTTLYIGAITIDNGEFKTPSNYAAPLRLRLLDDNGQSGSLIIRNSGYMQWANGSDWEIDGDLRVANGGVRAYSMQSLDLTMTGSSSVIDIDQNTYLRTLIVPEGASVSAGDGTGSKVGATRLELYGSMTGDVEIRDGGVMVTDNATWDSGVLRMRRDAGTWTAEIDAASLPNVDTQGDGYINGSPPSYRTYRLKRDLTVEGYLHFNEGYTLTYSRTWNDVFTTDNGNGYSWDLHVKGEFKTGGGSTVGSSGSYLGAFAGFYANDSTVDIDGDATFDKQAYVVGGTSTWKFGGNVSFTDAFVTAKAFDNVVEQGYGTDVSGATFVIDGAGAQNVDLAGQMALGNLQINKSGGTATLT